MKDHELDDPQNDGMDPDGPSAAQDSECSPVRAQFQPGERVADASESDFSAFEDLHGSFPIEQIPVGLAADGLPVPIEADPQDALAVPFTEDTVLCIEDEREYVEIFIEELAERGFCRNWFSGWHKPTEWGKGLSFEPVSMWKQDGTRLSRRRYDPAQVKEAFGVQYVLDLRGRPVPVRPRRERCKHYCRQVLSNDLQKDPAQPGHQIVFRVCTARRSNGGAYMSVSNEAVYACDVRNPFDSESSARQDDKDRQKLRDRPDRVLVPAFGLPGDEIHLGDKPQ